MFRPWGASAGSPFLQSGSEPPVQLRAEAGKLGAKRGKAQGRSQPSQAAQSSGRAEPASSPQHKGEHQAEDLGTAGCCKAVHTAMMTELRMHRSINYVSIKHHSDLNVERVRITGIGGYFLFLFLRIFRFVFNEHFLALGLKKYTS